MPELGKKIANGTKWAQYDELRKDLKLDEPKEFSPSGLGDMSGKAAQEAHTLEF